LLFRLSHVHVFESEFVAGPVDHLASGCARPSLRRLPCPTPRAFAPAPCRHS